MVVGVVDVVVVVVVVKILEMVRWGDSLLIGCNVGWCGVKMFAFDGDDWCGEVKEWWLM